MKKAVSIGLNVLFYLMIAAILGGALLFAFNPSQDKSILGYRYYEAMSNSMQPAIAKGDMVFVKLMPPKEANPGDVVTYAVGETGEVTVTHRLVEVYENAAGETMIVTKGDANDIADDPVPGANMIGVVTGCIPKLGSIIGTVRTNPLLFILPAAALVLLVVGIRSFLKLHKNTEAKKTVHHRV